MVDQEQCALTISEVAVDWQESMVCSANVAIRCPR